MKNFFIVVLVLAALVSVALAQQEQTNQNCPIQRTKQLMSNMMDRMRQMQSSASNTAQSARNSAQSAMPKMPAMPSRGE